MSLPLSGGRARLVNRVVRGSAAIGGLALAAGLIQLACTRDGAGVTGPTVDGVIEVRLLSSLRFDPAEITITPGTTVRWVNATNIFHTVTPDGHDEWTRFPTSQIGESFEHTFQTVGSFPYFCEPHQTLGMVGLVTVE